MMKRANSLPEVNPKQTPTNSHKPLQLPETDTKAVMQRAVSVIEHAYRFQDQVNQTIPKLRQESEAVVRRTAKTLASRTRELSAIQKTLQGNVKDVDQTLFQATQAFEKEEWKLENVPSDQKQAKEHAQSRVADLRAMVDELKATRSRVLEELRCKAAALEVDNSCRRVTPQMASEPKKQAVASLKTSSSMPTLTNGRSNLAVGQSTSSGRSGSLSSTGALVEADSTVSTAVGNGSFLPALSPKTSPINNKNSSSPGHASPLKLAASLHAASPSGVDIPRS